MERRASVACWALAMVLVGALPYANTLESGFTFDDNGLVVLNPYVPAHASLAAPFVGPSTSGSQYRPLTMVTYLLNHRAGGGPAAFHLTNVVLFGLTTGMAFLLAGALSRSVAVGVGTALVWAVHPIHTEGVASITGRAEILAALWMMAALLLLALRLDGAPGARRSLAAVGSLLAFAAALCSKESAAAGVLLVPLVVWLRAGERWKARAGIATLPYVALAMAFVAVRTLVVGVVGQDDIPFVDNPLAYVPAAVRIATAIVVLWQYVGLLTLPFGLSSDYSYDQVPLVASVTDPRLVVGLLGLQGIAMIAFVCRRDAPLVTFGILFTTAALAVTANVVAPIGTIKAERLLFLPSFGWCFAFGWGLAVWIGRPADRWRVLAASVVLAIFAMGTWTRNVDWRDDYTLLTTTAQVSPRSARAQANAGAVLGGAGDLAGAEQHFRRALAIHPGYEPALQGLAAVLRLTGRPAEAADAARRAAEATDVPR
jgi:hypothetical protein